MILDFMGRRPLLVLDGVVSLKDGPLLLKNVKSLASLCMTELYRFKVWGKNLFSTRDRPLSKPYSP